MKEIGKQKRETGRRRYLVQSVFQSSYHLGKNSGSQCAAQTSEVCQLEARKSGHLCINLSVYKHHLHNHCILD